MLCATPLADGPRYAHQRHTRTHSQSHAIKPKVVLRFWLSIYNCTPIKPLIIEHYSTDSCVFCCQMRSLVFRNNGSRVYRAIVMGNAARPRGIDSSRSVCVCPLPLRRLSRHLAKCTNSPGCVCVCARVYGVHCATTTATTRVRVIHTECAHGRTHNASRRGNRVHINICCARVRDAHTHLCATGGMREIT